MYQIKKCYILCLLIGLVSAICLCGCIEQRTEAENVDTAEYLNEEALQGNRKTQLDAYTIEEVFTDTFVVEYEANAQFYIQDSHAAFDYGKMLFDEFIASSGDYLEAGDVIAKVHIEVSEADLTEKRLALQRMQERVEADGIIYEKEDALLREDAYNTKGSQAQGVAMRQYEASVEKHRQDIENQKTQIDKTAEELAKMEEAAALTEIKAPSAGYLKDMPVLAYGDEIEDGKILGVLEPKKSSILLVNNEENAFRYGKEVSVICKKGVEELTFKGQVITPSEKSIALQAGNKKACVLLEEAGAAYLQGNEVNSILVKVNSMEQKNAVMVGVGCLEEGSSTYATVVQQDGSFLKKRVIIGGKNEEYYWVIEGLNAGDKVVVP